MHERLAGRAGLELPEPDREWLGDLEAWELLRLEEEGMREERLAQQQERWG